MSEFLSNLRLLFEIGQILSITFSFRMKIKALFTTTLLLFGLVSACSYNNFEDDIAEPPPLVNPCDTIPASFADTIFPIIIRYCGNQANGDCHYSGAATPKPDYTTYAGIKAKVDDGRLVARLFDQSPSAMPPAFSQGPQVVDECDKKLIRKWIDAGALNN